MDLCECEHFNSSDLTEISMARRRRIPLKFQDTASTDFFSYTDDGQLVKPVQRNTANARERARMRILSKAFYRLKGKLPFVPQDTKLSKLDTLRLASTYIAHLRKILRDDGVEGEYPAMQNGYQQDAVHPINLTWPFAFNSRSAYESSSASSTFENKHASDDFSQDSIPDNRNFVSCEYLGMNQSTYYRTETNQQYYQQYSKKG